MSFRNRKTGNALVDAAFDRDVVNEKEIERRLADALECAYCGCRSDAVFNLDAGGFNTFEKLGQHVQQCKFAPLGIPRDDFTNQAALILTRNYIKEKQMAGKVPGGFVPPDPTSDGSGEDTGPAYLSAKEMEVNARVSVRVLGFEEIEPSQYDPDTARFGLKIQFAGEERLLPVKLDSPNHRLLSSELGPTKQWVGKSVTITRMAAKKKGYNDFIGIVRSSQKKK